MKQFDERHPNSLKNRIHCIADEMREFIHEPSFEETWDVIHSVGRLIEDVTGTEAYFRSFYAKLQKTPALMALKQDSLDISGEKDISTFLPHVSLAYGVADKASRATEIAHLTRSLAGRNLRFDRMVIVSSSSETPIDQWIVKHEVYLAG